MYRHEAKSTTAFEKFVFHLLEAVFYTLESPSLSLLSAWGNLHPVTGVALYDATETLEKGGVSLLDHQNLAPFEKETDYGSVLME